MQPCSACGDPHPPGTVTCPRVGLPVIGGGPCGTRIERYEIQRFMGGGGFGAVYRARHVLLNQPVAIKLLRSQLATSADVLARFLTEARSAASIANPHVVRVTDFGTTHEGYAFLVMELLEGRDLDETIRAEGRLRVDRAVDVALQILDGVGAAHAVGVIHRDLKPGNVLLVRDLAGRDLVKIVDFGISKVQAQMSSFGDNRTRSGAVLGTPHYIPPEQFRGARDVDARADLYAVGVILYEMLSGTRPFDADTYENLIIKVCTEAPRPLAEVAPHVPRPIAQVIEQALANDPDRRWPSAAAMSDALQRSARSHIAMAETLTPVDPPPGIRLETGPMTPVGAPRVSAPPKLPERRLGLAVGGVLAALLIVGAGGAAAWFAIDHYFAAPVAAVARGPLPKPLRPAPPPSPPVAAAPDPDPFAAAFAPNPSPGFPQGMPMGIPTPDQVMPGGMEQWMEIMQQMEGMRGRVPPTTTVMVGEHVRFDQVIAVNVSAGQTQQLLTAAGERLHECRVPGRAVVVGFSISAGLGGEPGARVHGGTGPEADCIQQRMSVVNPLRYMGAGVIQGSVILNPL